jgi:hypothetical protein
MTKKFQKTSSKSQININDQITKDAFGDFDL